MVKHIWTVLAGNIITDRQTNLMSYINCIEEIVTTKLPVQLPVIGIGTIWEKDSDKDESLNLKISLVFPSGNVKDIFKSSNIVMTKKRHRLNIITGRWEINEEGVYKIKIEILENDGWATANEVPFMVQFKK